MTIKIHTDTNFDLLREQKLYLVTFLSDLQNHQKNIEIDYTIISGIVNFIKKVSICNTGSCVEIDFALLEKQRLHMKSLSKKHLKKTDIDQNLILGVITLIDGFQDSAVDNFGISEQVVFGKTFSEQVFTNIDKPTKASVLSFNKEETETLCTMIVKLMDMAENDDPLMFTSEQITPMRKIQQKVLKGFFVRRKNMFDYVKSELEIDWNLLSEQRQYLVDLNSSKDLRLLDERKIYKISEFLSQIMMISHSCSVVNGIGNYFTRLQIFPGRTPIDSDIFNKTIDLIDRVRNDAVNRLGLSKDIVFPID